MAVVTMGGDDKKPILHDFLAMSCGNSPAKFAAAGVAAELITMTGMETEASESASASAGVSSIGQGIITGGADQFSGRQTVNNSAVFLIHERKDGSSRPEASNTFSGKKRSNSDSAFMGFITDKIKPVCGDAAECSRSLKMLRKEVISDRSGKNQDELQFPIQSPLRSTSLHSPLGSRPVLHSSKLERPIPPNHGSIVQYPSHVAKTGLFSSSYVSKDANASAILMSQPAADEGSRTGIKSYGVLNVVTSSSGPGERSISRVLPYCSRPKCMQIHEPESSNASRYNGLPNVGRQMTVFYAGQAHVFDDVHPNKAEVIMALAGSTGGSWSTTYSQKPATCPSSGEVPTELIQRHINSFSSIQANPEHALCQVDKTTLTRDIPSLTSGGQESGRVVKDARLGIQTPLPSPAGQREAS
ncbi:protein TIFY 8 isoform X2 [Phalaenopsis equestris]|uniref:protein TIFY 8 isoform X2 n=1 Tax=Phalaenopsis equestris TaxID=78828 RepID=UPI0009E1C08B|nr:protein TIFY 8 isoform X2 [Phalaenopsis equestris]